MPYTKEMFIKEYYPEMHEKLQNAKREAKIENQLEIARNMLEEGSDIKFIAKVTGLSIQKIKELQKEL